MEQPSGLGLPGIASLRADLARIKQIDSVLRRHHKELHICMDFWMARQEQIFEQMAHCRGGDVLPQVLPAALPTSLPLVSVSASNCEANANDPSRFDDLNILPDLAVLENLAMAADNLFIELLDERLMSNTFDDGHRLRFHEVCAQVGQDTSLLRRDVSAEASREMSPEETLVLEKPSTRFCALSANGLRKSLTPVAENGDGRGECTRVSFALGETTPDSPSQDLAPAGFFAFDGITPRAPCQGDLGANDDVLGSPRRSSISEISLGSPASNQADKHGVAFSKCKPTMSDCPIQILDMHRGVVGESLLAFSRSNLEQSVSTGSLMFVGTLRQRIRHVVRHRAFEAVFGVLIALNGVAIGVEVQLQSQNRSYLARDPHGHIFSVLTMAFSFIFILELSLRLTAFGWSFFFSNEWAWNLFDFALVGLTFVDWIYGWLMMPLGLSTDNDAQNSAFRVVRVLRVVRNIRIVRMVRFFRELRIMVYAIGCSLKSLVWLVVLLTMMLFLFALVFTMGVTEQLWNIDSGTDTMTTQKYNRLETHYGSLGASIFSLFMGMSGGISWGELVLPLDFSWLHVSLFIGYISFAIFAVLNVVTGVFVENAMQTSQDEVDMVLQEELQKRKAFMQRLTTLFTDIDTDNSGTISYDEFCVAFQDENVRSCFKMLQIDVDQLENLFCLIDLEDTGTVAIDEFMNGCVRLKGEAKSIDIATLMYENRKIMHAQEHFMRFCEEQFAALTGTLLHRLSDNASTTSSPPTSGIRPSAMAHKALWGMKKISSETMVAIAKRSRKEATQQRGSADSVAASRSSADSSPRSQPRPPCNSRLDSKYLAGNGTPGIGVDSRRGRRESRLAGTDVEPVMKSDREPRSLALVHERQGS